MKTKKAKLFFHTLYLFLQFLKTVDLNTFVDKTTLCWHVVLLFIVNQIYKQNQDNVLHLFLSNPLVRNN